MGKFAGLPPSLIGVDKVPPTLLAAVNALIENVATLIGQRGDAAQSAVLKGFITLNLSPTPKLKSLSASGKGLILGGTAVPDHKDYVNLVRDVSALQQDVVVLHNTVNKLIAQLKG